MKELAVKCKRIDETVRSATTIMTPNNPLDTAPSDKPYRIFSVAPNPRPQAAPYTIPSSTSSISPLTETFRKRTRGLTNYSTIGATIIAVKIKVKSASFPEYKKTILPPRLFRINA